jgi:hypothetical protein
MVKVRIIHFIKGDLESEQLSIVDDFDSPAQDFCPPHYKMASDTVHNMDLPDNFPLNNDWIRFG